MKELLVYYRNTKDRMEYEHESEVMERMEAEAEIIDYDEWAALIDEQSLHFIAESLGYGPDLELREDWHVSFYRSEYGGCECAYLGHSECDFIFLKTKDALMLQEAFAKGIDPLQWYRHTAFGKETVDPK